MVVPGEVNGAEAGTEVGVDLWWTRKQPVPSVVVGVRRAFPSGRRPPGSAGSRDVVTEVHDEVDPVVGD